MQGEVHVEYDSDEFSFEVYHPESSSPVEPLYTEEELLSLSTPITAEMVRTLRRSTSGYLCDPTIHTIDMDFTSFQMIDPTVDQVVFYTNEPDCEVEPHAGRFRQYTFKSSILDLPYLAAEVRFSLGDEPIYELRVVENLFLGDTRLKSYDFNFGDWQANCSHLYRYNYTLPPLTDEMKRAMIDNPQSTTADSFFFVDDKLVLHCKASFVFEEEL